MITALRSRDKSGSKVNALLHTSETSQGGPTPHRQTVKYVGENVGLYEKLENVWCKMMADLVQG